MFLILKEIIWFNVQVTYQLIKINFIIVDVSVKVFHHSSSSQNMMKIYIIMREKSYSTRKNDTIIGFDRVQTLSIKYYTVQISCSYIYLR